MILILEVMMTVSAWRHGWRGWALVPLAATFMVGFFIGVALESTGGSLDDVMPAALLFDVGCLGVLGCMIANPRVTAETVPESVPGDEHTAPVACTEMR